MADGRHIEIVFRLYLNKLIINKLNPINAKFCRIKQNHVLTQVYDQNTKFRKFKMVDGRHFENGYIAISQP